MIERKHICLFALVFLTACGLYQNRTDKLKEAIMHFNEGVRWGRTQDVLSRIDPKAESHFLEMHKDFGRTLKVTEVEVVNTSVNLEEGLAEVGIKLVWYRIDEMVVHETILQQRWEEKKGNWRMVAEEFRDGTPF